MKPTEDGVEELPATGEVKPLQSILQVDKGRIQVHLDAVVRSTVEETLNALLEAEADRWAELRRSSQPVWKTRSATTAFLPNTGAR